MTDESTAIVLAAAVAATGCPARLGSLALCGKPWTHRIEWCDGETQLVCAPHATIYERIARQIGRPLVAVSRLLEQGKVAPKKKKKRRAAHAG